MCYGENNAPHAVSYANSQLEALWKIASECVEHHDTQLKPESNYRYSFALAKFYYGKHRFGAGAALKDMMFQATFKAPQLGFVCNHEATFEVNVKEGHYNLDHGRASDMTTADPNGNRNVVETSFLFRVPFKMTGVKGRDPKIGNNEVTVSMVVLDFRNAKLTKITPEVQQGRQSLEAYLLAYLQFLQSAGHHVLFSLPNFDDEGLKPFIDFSQIAEFPLTLGEVHGVAIAKINEYLSASWLKAVMLAGAANGQPVDRPSISLAEYRSTWVLHDHSGLHFHLKFGAPQVAALCNDELVMTFVVDEVLFYEGEKFDEGPLFKKYMNWRISVLMNIEHETEEDGKVTRCRIDLHSSRYMHQYSSFEGYVDSDQDATECVNAVVEFISGEYLSILENAQYNIVYQYDVRWPTMHGLFDQAEHHDEVESVFDDAEWTGTGFEESGGRMSSRSMVWRDICQHSDMCGFDQITALSQTAVNGHFRSSWMEEKSSSATTGLLSQWEKPDCFKAVFKPLSIRLRSDGRAIIFVNLEEGYLKPLKNGAPSTEGEKFNFSEWRVAFEVDLKMCDHVDLPGVGGEWGSRFEQSTVHQEHGGRSDVTFKHIYLSLTNAEFLHGFSRFEGLSTTNNRRSVDKIQAVIVCIRDYYLKQLASAGHHVLYTIPVYRTGPSTPPAALTSAVFHVYSKTVSKESNWTEQSSQSEPIIIIVGMCGGRPLPAAVLQYSTDWVAHSGKSWAYGTASIASSLFLRDLLLPKLFKVNASTTVIPFFSGIERDQWKLDLKSWAKHPQSSEGDCPFEFVPGSGNDGSLRYQWHHQDKYNYEHKGGSYIMNGNYTVSSVTENYLEIPTTFKHGTLEIKLHGKVELELGVKTYTTWKSKSTAYWKASLAVHSEAGGLRVSVSQNPHQFTKAVSIGETFRTLALDPQELLREALKDPLDLEGACGEFKAFEKVWQYCYPGTKAYNVVQPAFNSKGDLLFQVRPQSTPGSAPARTGRSPTSPRLATSYRSAHSHSRARSRVRRGGVQQTFMSSDQMPGSHYHGESLRVNVENPGMHLSPSYSSNGSAEPNSLSANENSPSPLFNSTGNSPPMHPQVPFQQFQDSSRSFSRPGSSMANRPSQFMGNAPETRPLSSMSHRAPSGTYSQQTSTFAGYRDTRTPMLNPQYAGPDEIDVRPMSAAGLRGAVPGIRVDDTTSVRNASVESFSRSHMASPRPVPAMPTAFGGSASGRATPQMQHMQSAQHMQASMHSSPQHMQATMHASPPMHAAPPMQPSQPVPLDMRTAEGRRLLREQGPQALFNGGAHLDGFDVQNPLVPTGVEIRSGPHMGGGATLAHLDGAGQPIAFGGGGEYRSTSRMSSRGGGQYYQSHGANVAHARA